MVLSQKPGINGQYLRHFLVGRVERSGTRHICWLGLRSTQPTFSTVLFDTLGVMISFVLSENLVTLRTRVS